MYTQDYDETTPRNFCGSLGFEASTAVGDTPDRYKWMDALQPYVKNTQIFVCPSTSNLPYIPRTSLKPGETTRKYGSYAYNRAYGQFDLSTDLAPAGKALAALEVPADTVWFAESVGGSQYDFDFHWYDVATNPIVTKTAPRKLVDPTDPVNIQYLIERHQGKSNILWCDGHAKATSLDALTAKNSQGYMYRFTVTDDQNQ